MANAKNPFEALFKQMSAEIIKATKSHYFATVTSVTTGGIGLSIDGDTSGTKKFTCNRGEKFASGDRVLVAKESGTYVVICKIGSPGGPVAKTSYMTRPVGVDSSGALWTEPSSYTLPTASSTTLGGVKPTAKTTAMTQSVGVDSSGALWTTPGNSGGGKVTTLYSSTTGTNPYTLTLNTSGDLVPNTYSQYGVKMGLGSSTYWMGECYLGGYSALHLGNNSTSTTLGFFGVTPQTRQTLMTTTQNMSYSSANANNYLTILNNLVGILANKYGLIKT